MGVGVRYGIGVGHSGVAVASGGGTNVYVATWTTGAAGKAARSAGAAAISAVAKRAPGPGVNG